MPTGATVEASLFTRQGPESVLVSGAVLFTVAAPESSGVTHISAKTSTASEAAHHLIGKRGNLAAIHIYGSPGK